MTEQENKDQVSFEDLLAYKDALSKALVAASNAEKAFAESKAAQAEAKYVVLSIYYKYKLEPGKDDIADDGRILRNVRNPQGKTDNVEQAEKPKEESDG